MKVNLRIDRIVLDGIALSPAETRRMTRALERELTTKVAEMAEASGPAPGTWHGGAVPSLAASEIALEPRTDGARFGRALARSILGEGLRPMMPSAAPAQSAPKDGERS